MGNKNKPFSGETERNGEWGMGNGEWGMGKENGKSSPEKVWWPPVWLIFYSFIIVKFLYNLILYEFL